MSKKIHFGIYAVSIGFALLAAGPISAQFPIKIPGLTKKETPKQEKPTVDRSDSSGQPSVRETGDRRSANVTRGKANDKPVLLRDTLDISTYEVEYGKPGPTELEWSWLPKVNFFVFYNNSSQQRFTADWFNPDGSPWFSESLKYGYSSGGEEIVRISNNDRDDDELDKFLASKPGTYGLKITNSKTGEVAFQGKFKVNKLPPAADDPKSKEHRYYVDHDWLLPMGYVGYEYEDNWEAPTPTVWMWFKGRQHKGADFEARLFYKGQQIASTDEHCSGNCIRATSEERREGCYTQEDLCTWGQWKFEWKNFITINQDYDFFKKRVANTTATNDSPGEYTVKIFYKNAQVREANFTVDVKGGIAPNAFSSQIYLTNHKVALPVKVSGTLEKWNPTAWKTDLFYQNPLTGFSVP